MSIHRNFIYLYLPNRKLAGKTVYITGASRGIGEAIGLKCAKDGANVSFDRISFIPEKQPSVFKISFILCRRS